MGNSTISHTTPFYTISFASAYPLYLAKAEKKGCTKAEVTRKLYEGLVALYAIERTA